MSMEEISNIFAADASPCLTSHLPSQTLATEYYNHIIENIPSKDYDFKPLMTLYLTDNTTPEEIKKAMEAGFNYAA